MKWNLRVEERNIVLNIQGRRLLELVTSWLGSAIHSTPLKERWMDSSKEKAMERT
jgi:hypothetical protein